MAETRGKSAYGEGAGKGGNSVAVVAGKSVGFAVSRDRGVSAVIGRFAGILRSDGGDDGGKVGGNRGGAGAAPRGAMFLLPGGGDVAGRAGGGKGGIGGAL